MTYLLDTHIFIWWHSEPSKLSLKVLDLIKDPQNVLLLSLASVWEMQIKIALGKLRLNIPLRDVLDEQQKANHIQLFPVTLEHILGIAPLPDHHKDPFDRLLVAQCIVEKIPMLTDDPLIARYPLQTIW